MKTIYFVRHGVTRLNRSHRHQYPETPLSELGKDQAGRAAMALTGKGIEVVLSSDYARARETAQIIESTLHVDREESELLREVVRPTYLWGKHHFCPRSLFFIAWYFLTALVSEHRWNNEETVRQFERRLAQALDMLTKRPESTICVVTHRGVMTGLVPLLHNSTTWLTLRTVWSFLNIYAVDNAEITKVTYHEGKWDVEEANTNAHLQA